MIVAKVQVREDRGTRTTRITVIEGVGGDVWPTRATSVPPVVREKLTHWLADVPGAVSPDAGVHVAAGALLQASEDAPGPAARGVGFTVGGVSR